jgi:hypothetical protein
MLLATQISSFAIPKKIWANGYDSIPGLPPLALIARDALAIERRSNKGVNLLNEQRRYTLCCERMQGIIEELAVQDGLLRPPLVWPVEDTQEIPSARAYLAIIEVIISWMRKHLSVDEKERVEYIRFPRIFFPPDHATLHLKQFDFLSHHAEISSLFELAAQTASIKDSRFLLSSAECKRAFELRYELLKGLAAQNLGLVDVLDLV